MKYLGLCKGKPAILLGVALVFAIGALFLASGLRTNGAEPAGKGGPAEWPQDLKEVFNAFPGVVDVYLDRTELSTGKPSLPGVTIRGAFPAGGVHWFYVKKEATEEVWLLRSTEVTAVKLASPRKEEGK